MPRNCLIDQSCIECGDKGVFNKLLNHYVCSICKHIDKYKLITKTNAKSKYFLKKEDLQQLRAFHGRSSYGPATYYLESDLVELACAKHNLGSDTLYDVLNNWTNEKQRKREQKLKVRTEKKQTLIETRKDELISALQEYGLVLRSDSKLCQLYIDGRTDYSIDDVVKRMCQMKYLFEYCHMDECKNIAYQQYIEELDAGYIPDCSVFDSAEEIALRKYSNGEYPLIFPWFIEYKTQQMVKSVSNQFDAKYFEN